VLPHGTPPPPIEADAMVFHEISTSTAPPKVRRFVVTINLGVSTHENKRSDTNVAILLGRFVDFAKQTNTEFHIEPLNDSDQCMTNPSNIPTIKEGVDLYYQHRVVADGIRGKLNVTMDEMKDPATPFRKYLNQDKVYVSPAALGLVDTRIVGVMLQTDPQISNQTSFILITLAQR
jgi:hypothetical protein